MPRIRKDEEKPLVTYFNVMPEGSSDDVLYRIVPCSIYRYSINIGYKISIYIYAENKGNKENGTQQTGKLTTHLQLVARLKMRASIPPVPHALSWREA
jgi:hypothetical protein